ncbi:hypothetical protein EV426DRAFT_369811 [Tirmania nivea]|nr:hypothetical protein EV426DRAFT_369811 [Tirmania nivea]
MVSFWPFGRRDDNSPDSFERILAKLTNQIQAQQTKLNSLRIQSRRYKALWTIYNIIAWMLYMVVLMLVVGWQQLRMKEISGAVGGPIIIYLGRRLLVWFFDRRITLAETTLADLTHERGETIEKLKTATKFYSTQSLLEKYGGGSEMTEDDRRSVMSRKGSMAGPTGFEGMNGQQSLRMRNIPAAAQGSVRGKPPQMLITPSGQPQQQQQQGQALQQGRSPSPVGIDPLSISPSQRQIQDQLRSQQSLRPTTLPGQIVPGGAGSPQPSPTRTTFSIPPPPTAPAYPPAPGAGDYLAPQTDDGSHSWYDRLLDVLIGEDETAAKARYALICSSCRMVNGLAPPGTKSLAEIGRWGCARCGTMNGKDLPKKKKGPATVRKEGDVREVKELIEREIAEEMLGKSVKRGSGRSRGSIRGWTKQIQELQAQQEAEEGEEDREEEEKEESSDEEGDEEVKHQKMEELEEEESVHNKGKAEGKSKGQR